MSPQFRCLDGAEAAKFSQATTKYKMPAVPVIVQALCIFSRISKAWPPPASGPRHNREWPSCASTAPGARSDRAAQARPACRPESRRASRLPSERARLKRLADGSSLDRPRLIAFEAIENPAEEANHLRISGRKPVGRIGQHALDRLPASQAHPIEIHLRFGDPARPFQPFRVRHLGRRSRAPAPRPAGRARAR